MLTGKLVSLYVISPCAVFLLGGGSVHGECNCHMIQRVSVCLKSGSPWHGVKSPQNICLYV
jgi:hypothetical protein